ncbi:MAG TPA: SDR family oxidoreductase [Dehalococcoidia bacterium]|jgi:NAD(P)-dependent dehydrogenase (short-subunit alcohol dehydrogenase family)
MAENRPRRALAAGAGIAVAAFAATRLLNRLREVDLRGQTALVTGGSRGLGYLLARKLVQEGCRVAICARDVDELERAFGDLARSSGEVLALPCDVGDRYQVEELIERVEDRLGPIDVLVNNAGIIQAGPLEALTLQDFEQALSVMYWGVVYPTLAVLPGMKARRHGRIVNITSIGGLVSVPHLLPYSSAKFAAVGFSEGLRAELAGTGVLVTTVAPGLMRTGSHVNALFAGRAGQEFTWFSLGASLPIVSMSAERAARQIVGALKRGEAHRVLSIPATLLARGHGLSPGTTANVLGLVNRLILPRAGGAGEVESGQQIQATEPSRLRDVLTTLGRRAAERNHEYPGPSVPLPERDGATMLP